MTPFCMGIILIKEFSMNIDVIRKHAEGLGLEGVAQMDMVTLIRAIQVREGNSPCYATNWCKKEWSDECRWQNACHASEYFPSVGG